MKQLLITILIVSMLSPTAVPQAKGQPRSVELPVLAYHHLDENPTSESTTTPELFEAHLLMLRRLGYNTVSVMQIIRYVYFGIPLPDKPILITFDDGYMSNYDLAFPILKKHGMKAVIFVIGSTFGSSNYKDTDYDITPHFGEAEAKEMIASGLIEVQSHTFDCHMWQPYESTADYRFGINRKYGEGGHAYIDMLKTDIKKMDALISSVSGSLYAMAYPYGIYNGTAEKTAAKSGIKVTFTIEPRMNCLVPGDEESLRLLGRFTVSDKMTAADIRYILTNKKLPK